MSARIGRSRAAHRASALIGALLCGACAGGSRADPDDGNAAGKSGTTPAASAGRGGAAASAASTGGAAGGGSGGSSGAGPTAGASAGSPSIAADAVLRSGCARSTVQSELLPANILFVVDRTGTMACNPPPLTESASCETTPQRADAAQPSKWEITSEALIEAMQALPPNATVGVSYFSNDEFCGVNSQPSVPLAPNDAAQRGAIETSLRAVQPGGGTPLVGATVLAYKHLHELALAGSITGNEFVVLISDGEQSEECSYVPRCSDAATCYRLLLDEDVPKAAAAGVGIRTFVIGAPGSELAREVLSTIAARGNTGAPGCDAAQGNCHFDMTKETDFGAALGRALTAIVGQTVSCELAIPAPKEGETVDLERVNVVYTKGGSTESQVLRNDTRAACDQGADGWQYTADNSAIRLCGPTCDRVRGDAGARVDVVLGCPRQGPQ